MPGASPEMERLAEQIARGLASARAEGSDIVVTTSVSFPSGRRVGVRLLGGPLSWTVTDDGCTMREAELMGAEDICRREARAVAEKYQIKFTDWELFEGEAPTERLVGFVVIVANAAALTMIRTADKFAERFELRQREALTARLTRVFGETAVQAAPEMAGASTKVWRFDALVNLPSGRPGLFALVSPSPISVAFAYSKFDDVSRVEAPPFIGAVVQGKLAPDDSVLIRRAARRVFAANDPDEVFRLAA